MKRPWPMRSSTLSPKIQRNSMFPRKCIHPPCRNIDVNTELSVKLAGTTPYSRDEERQLAVAEGLLEEEGERVQAR